MGDMGVAMNILDTVFLWWEVWGVVWEWWSTKGYTYVVFFFFFLSFFVTSWYRLLLLDRDRQSGRMRSTASPPPTYRSNVGSLLR